MTTTKTITGTLSDAAGDTFPYTVTITIGAKTVAKVGGGGTTTLPPPSTGNTGWTTFVPTAPVLQGNNPGNSGTNQIYVSSSTGNDSTGTGTQANPYATIGKGSSIIRNGKPDWLLLKCGDTFTNDNYSNINFSGPGAVVTPAWSVDADHTVSGVILLGYYGTGPRPLLQSNTSNGFITIEATNTFSNMAINGWDFYGYTRDPANGAFTTAESLQQITALDILLPGTNLILEDNKVSFCGDGIDIQAGSNYGVVWNNVTLRRNVIVNNYLAAAGGGGKAQGLYITGTSGTVLLEENFFDLNGWNPTVANADQNIFSHNLYYTVFGNVSPICRRNIFARDAGGEQFRYAPEPLYNNLFIEIASGMACSAAKVTMSYNVWQQATDITGVNASGRGWGYGVQGVLPGSTSDHDIISNMDSTNTGGEFAFTIDLSSWTGNFATGSFNITNIDPSGSADPGLESFPVGATISGPHIQSGTTIVSASGFTPSGPGTVVMSKTATGNATGEGWQVNTTGFALSNFIAFKQSGGIIDNGISTTQTNICNDPSGTNSGQPGEPFPAPTRTIASYSASVGGAGTWQDFLAQCALQRKANWNIVYAANPANNYLRAGVNFPQL